jgi:hypothetical protein
MILFEWSGEVPLHAVKKNSKVIRMNRRTGRPFIMSNDLARQQEDFLIRCFQIEALEVHHRIITQPVILCCQFVYPSKVYYTQKGEISKRLADLSNLYQSVEDALQQAKIIENDRLIIGHDGSRRICGTNSHQLHLKLQSSQ